VVLDLPHTLNETTIAALDAADDVILLLTLDIPSIRSAKRALDLFRRLGYDPQRIKVVLNRFTRTPDFDPDQVAKVLDASIYAFLSNDYRAAIASVNVGEPLVQSRIQSKLIREFTVLATRLSGVKSQEEEPSRKKKSWPLFGRK
jgi:pilus assembly protein CpaE